MFYVQDQCGFEKHDLRCLRHECGKSRILFTPLQFNVPLPYLKLMNVNLCLFFLFSSCPKGVNICLCFAFFFLCGYFFFSDTSNLRMWALQLE